MFVAFYIFWVRLSIIAFILFAFRTDAKVYAEDINKFVKGGTFFVYIITVLFILFILPFTIIHSLTNIINRIKNGR